LWQSFEEQGRRPFEGNTVININWKAFNWSQGINGRLSGACD
jgi:hypothetical protein